MKPIVDAAWLADHLADVVVCHVGTAMTGPDPYGDYLAGHLPGAHYVSLEDMLAGPAAPVVGRHPLPTPTAFAEGLGAIGIDTETAVVAYDDRGGAFAARLAWMLRIIGQEAAVLDGGLGAWAEPLETGPVAAPPTDRVPVEWPAEALADADDVQAHLDAEGVVVDSREPARYRGETEPIDARAGHVPGAINLPFADNLDDGRFRPTVALAARFEPVARDPHAIVYCGSGVTACHNALAIEAAGLPRPRVYVGSWSGWSTDPARPIATG
ncbi:MAG: sulfurtransferase [Ilumatobacter sp.]|nr:sulfurtransferase [Ilumatobacter sp.]